MNKFFGLILILSFNGANAAEIFDSYRSVRAMGMGGAHTAVVQGIDSLFYNPASLAEVRGFNISLLDVGAGVTDVNKSVLDSLDDLGDSSTIGQALQDLYGQPLSGAANLKLGVTLPGFGIAGFGQADISLIVNNPVIPNLEVNAILDAGVALGFAKRISSFINFGVVAKQINRYGDRQTFTASTVSQLDPDAIEEALDKKGTGLGIDIGLDFIGRGSVFIPKLSVVYKNLGDTSFTDNNNEFGPPPSQKEELVYAASLIFDAQLASLTLAADYRHVLKKEVSDGKKIHAGAELSLPLLDLRVGLNQGYLTYGTGINFGLFRLDASSYGLEIGEKLGQQEDRRYSAQISIEFGFDFSSTIGSKKKWPRFKNAGRKGKPVMGTSGGRRAYKRKFYRNYLKQRR